MEPTTCATRHVPQTSRDDNVSATFLLDECDALRVLLVAGCHAATLEQSCTIAILDGVQQRRRHAPVGHHATEGGLRLAGPKA
eukprot:CAMPEP_0181249704 /NCGR_PEP_ID=MMETSP1096-20121128/45909_1 /TAXON_ID=156174 ORGANISM="Chrysochromulina ericina, Strain CCMP281" /NCGR_SAMPLE_ID=MMETSP1096 /ASSEMBLY_ACC=CAM_ASM_000453 /LENGTH=82 /DNA_ID=CAMNT_0023347085 /DNA_START=120 /DNA_END=368 /DNA_ORIENTATION=+